MRTSLSRSTWHVHIPAVCYDGPVGSAVSPPPPPPPQPPPRRRPGTYRNQEGDVVTTKKTVVMQLRWHAGLSAHAPTPARPRSHACARTHAPTPTRPHAAHAHTHARTHARPHAHATARTHAKQMQSPLQPWAAAALPPAATRPCRTRSAPSRPPTTPSRRTRAPSRAVTRANCPSLHVAVTLARDCPALSPCETLFHTRRARSAEQRMASGSASPCEHVADVP